MRRVNFVLDYNIKQIIIRKANQLLRIVSTEIYLILNLFIVEFDETDEENDDANILCKLLLNEQENE